LSNYRNTLSRVIPERIITRPPSAELRANQLDQDSLPPYDVLDGIIEAYVEDDLSHADIIAQGYLAHDVNRVITMIDRNEYKRRQSPVGVRITHKGFGRDRRYPITVRLTNYN
ncbi:MAG: NAD+ synthase, partial [Methylotenera sp.]|nr:NAD+ synthase [Methylotenera sp.]